MIEEKNNNTKEPQKYPEADKKTGKKVFRFGVASVVLVLVFAFGFSIGSNESPGVGGEKSGEVKNTEEVPEFLSEDVDFRQFWQIWEYVQENYVDADVSDTRLFYGAIAGMVGALQDPYSVYLDPEITDRFNDDLSGSFQGIGAEIGMREGVLTIIAPLPGTPAAQSGLRAGDFVLAIDDFNTAGIALDRAVNLIRGPKGEEVVLTIAREGENAPREISIIRDTIEIDSVRVGVSATGEINEPDSEFVLEEGGIAYLELLYFNENTLADWNQTMQKVLAENPQGIILDLRNNPGGFLDVAIEIAGEWANGKVVVSEKFRDGQEISHRANRQARLADIPTVVLVNGGSASGSEIVAGALKDYGEATIVGEQTFGKGSVQNLQTFRDGSSIKLTIAEWFTPNGQNINDQGITPDVVVEMTQEDFDNGADPQLERAFEILME